MTTRRTRLSRVLPMAAAALVVGTTAQAARADDDDETEIPFDEATLFFELNDTDGDLGIHALIDGDAWRTLAIEDPNELQILLVRVKRHLAQQGLTELFLESAEPPFDELPPEKFFERFPAGIYEIEGFTLGGEELESEVELTHVLPAPPDDIRVNGEPAAEDCDAEDLPVVSNPVTISWAEVAASHPEIGEAGPLVVDRYQVVVEREEPTLLVFSVDLPPSATEVQAPPEFINLGAEFKFEIVVREESGNQTAVESCFEVEGNEE